MGDEFDINQVAADFVEANLDRILEAVSSGFKGAKNLLRSKFKRTYEEYLKRLLEKHSKAKPFFRSEPTPLYRFFVPLNLSTDQRILERASVTNVTAVSPHSIITGSGGSGKSMLMRHLLVSCIRSGRKTPIFIELRQLNQQPDLTEAVLKSLRANGLEVDQDYLELALRAGHFCFLLDGFDELEIDLRKSVVEQVLRLASYAGNWVILSSRPDSQLNALTDFVQFEIDPLDIDGAVELVSRLPFDDALKTKFIVDLRNELFDKHRSFISNPLLLSIMLLTYSDTAHIPQKLSLYYNQAYEALFQRHDALKGGFKRQHRSSLDIQEFERALSAFCILSYDATEFKFPRITALDYFDKAKNLCQLAYDNSDILDDCIQSVCILLEDGLDIAFAHRSFQEYFTARFIAACAPQLKQRLIQRCADRVQNDAVMDLLFEIDPVSLERYYILPAIDSIKQRIGFHGKVGTNEHLAYIRTLYEDFDCRCGQVLSTTKDRSLVNAAIFTRRHYQNDFALWPDGIEAEEWENRTISLFDEEFGAEHDIPTQGLKPTSKFVASLATSTGLWGTRMIEDLIRVGDKIGQRHKQTEMSIAELLGPKSKQRRRR